MRFDLDYYWQYYGDSDDENDDRRLREEGRKSAQKGTARGGMRSNKKRKRAKKMCECPDDEDHDDVAILQNATADGDESILAAALRLAGLN